MFKSNRLAWILALPTIALLVLIIPSSVQAEEVDARPYINRLVTSTLTRAELESDHQCTIRFPYRRWKNFASFEFQSDANGDIVFINKPSGKDAIVQPVDADTLRAPGEVPNGPHYLHGIAIAFCSFEEANKIATLEASQQPNAKLDAVSRFLIWAILGLQQVTANIAFFILSLSAKLMGGLLTADKFVSHSFVTTGWPFLQGIANIGFIVALLFIAFSTTLGLQIGGGDWRKLLPRLLIAALLINFSLVIGGLLIDLSRLSMAVLVSVLGGDLNKVSNIGLALLSNSDILTSVIHVLGDGGLEVKTPPDSWSAPFKVMQAILLLWALAAGFLLTTALLFARWIALILLLVISPLAYLSAAMPGMQQFTSWWWKNFIQWVVYGPIALFILILITRIPSTEGPSGTVGESLFNVILTIAMLFAAFLVTKKASAIGAQGTLNVVTGAGKKAGKAIAKRPALAGAIAGTALTGGVGGAAVGALAGVGGKAGARQIGLQTKDAVDITKGRIRDFAKGSNLLKRFAPARRDKEGKLLPGETSWASKQFSKLPYTGRKAEQYNAAHSMASAGPVNVTDPSVAGPRLANKHVTDALMNAAPGADKLEHVKMIIDQGSMAQVKNLLKNREFLAGLDDTQRNEIQIAIQGKAAGTELRVPSGAPPGTLPSPVAVTYSSNITQRTVERLVDIYDQLDNAK